MAPDRAGPTTHRAQAMRGWVERGAAAGLLLLVTAFSVVAITATRQVSLADDRAAQFATRADLYQDARYYVVAMEAGFEGSVNGEGPAAIHEMRAADGNLARTLADLVDDGDAVPADVQPLRHLAAGLTVSRTQAERLFLAGRRDAALAWDHQHADPVAALLRVEVGGREEAARADSVRELGRAHRAARTLAVTTPIALGACLAIGVALLLILHRHRRRIAALASTDSLTSLPNRLDLQERGGPLVTGATSRRAADRPALLLLDLDHFKDVNDSLGHHVGDQLLVQAAHRIAATMKSTDLVARLGGDEFAVLLSSGGDVAARVVAERLRTALRAPFVIDELLVDIDVSIGIAVAADLGEDDPITTLLRRADVSMYDAKKAGGGYAIYDCAREDNSQDRIRMISELHRAIDDDQLVVHYQPKIALHDGRLLGVEALVRLQHPTRGLLAPGAFLPIVGDGEVLDALTVHVIAKSLGQLRRWAAQGRDIPVAVNISPRSLLNGELAAVIERLLRSSGVPANRLCLEITESALLRNPTRAAKVVRALRQLGVRLSLDDYGTGYSSMTYLRELPIQELKIDASFVTHMSTDPQSAILARSVIELGHNLGLVVIAEGVEDDEVLRMLQRFGCDEAQGYYFARAMPGETVLAWDDERRMTPSCA